MPFPSLPHPDNTTEKTFNNKVCSVGGDDMGVDPLDKQWADLKPSSKDKDSIRRLKDVTFLLLLG